jgi:hypothetical protein
MLERAMTRLGLSERAYDRKPTSDIPNAWANSVAGLDQTN